MTLTPRPTGRHVLKAVCRSAAGQVAAIAALIERHGGYVEEFAVHDDRPSERFFVRAMFRCPDPQADVLPRLSADLDRIAPSIQALQWQVHDLAVQPRVLLMVSRLDHCLVELLAGWKRGELPMQPVGIVSNHPDL
ncbi:MAG: formyltetrahydrofolate deformylase, partial [Pseudomonadota bacterium]